MTDTLQLLELRAIRAQAAVWVTDLHGPERQLLTRSFWSSQASFSAFDMCFQSKPAAFGVPWRSGWL